MSIHGILPLCHDLMLLKTFGPFNQRPLIHQYFVSSLKVQHKGAFGYSEFKSKHWACTTAISSFNTYRDFLPIVQDTLLWILICLIKWSRVSFWQVSYDKIRWTLTGNTKFNLVTKSNICLHRYHYCYCSATCMTLQLQGEQRALSGWGQWVGSSEGIRSSQKQDKGSKQGNKSERYWKGHWRSPNPVFPWASLGFFLPRRKVLASI